MLPLTVTRKSGEAAKYLAALAAHELSVEQHYEALEKARPMLGRFNFPQWSALRFEAEALAERDGQRAPRFAIDIHRQLCHVRCGVGVLRP